MTSCPDPGSCPVAPYARLAAAPRHVIRAGTGWARAYDGTWGCDEPNPGKGDTRFAPFRDDAGNLVPTMYLADNQVGALLETVFHDTDPVTRPDTAEMYEALLYGQLLAFLSPPVDLVMVDLRDDALAKLGVPREAIASSPSEHYPCTRNVAAAFLDADPAVQGIVWHSRQAEFHRAAGRAVDPSEVAVVFSDRVPLNRGGWEQVGTKIVALASGEGRTMVDLVAGVLNVKIITS